MDFSNNKTKFREEQPQIGRRIVERKKQKRLTIHCELSSPSLSHMVS
jgi:hypothetical protein